MCCRTSFFLYEQLSEKEGLYIEFKNWGWPLNGDKMHWSLRKTISGFASTHGGIILLGVTDGGRVVGEFYDEDRKR